MIKDEQRGETVVKLNKRRETMEDGRRYIIYYTFNQAGKPETGDKKEKTNV